MRRSRSWIVLLILGMVVLALIVQRTMAPARGASVEQAKDSDVASIATADEGATLRGERDDDSTAFTVTIDAWRTWADEHLVEALGEAVRIGDQEMPPVTFDRFGVARLAPDGARVAFTATAYAVLTTVSLLMLLDLTDGSLEVVRQPMFGGVGAMVWSPGGRYVALVLDGARASGDALRIDDTRERRRERSVSTADVLAAASAGHIDARQWLPGFRDPRWVDEHRLLITTNDPACSDDSGSVRWIVTVGADGRGGAPPILLGK
ncbi:MAG: hypothetical protein H0U69_13775 [Trueperaceae bacterium]|nr:hypothetical protein [Trueperaceae bacterium]